MFTSNTRTIKAIALPLIVATLAGGCTSGDVSVTPSTESPNKSLAGNRDLSPAQDQLGDSKQDAVSDAEIVQADVRANMDAVYQGETETVLKYTHPKIIEMMGGRTQAKNTLETALSQTQAIGMRLESLDFPEDPTFLKTELNDFAIIPTKSVIIANGQRVESLNYQLGIKTAGTSNWTYIEGSRINKENVGALFPDFPSDYDFPSFYRKKLL